MNPTGSQLPSIGTVDANLPPQDSIAGREVGLVGLVSDVIALTKAPANIAVVVTAFVGFALHADILGHWILLLHTLAGTAFLAAGSAMANQAREYKFDQVMARTRHRPIAAGRLHPGSAFRISGALSIAGCLWLGTFVNARAMSLAGLAFIIYVFAYTPMKRLGPGCIPVGAVSGALPVLVGWAATSAEFGFWSVVAFAVLFLWQIPHFVAIAWWRQRDYSRAGYRILPNHDERGRRTSQWALLSALVVSVVSLAPAMANRTTLGYLIGSLSAGILFISISVRFAVQRNEASARSLFVASLYYLPAIFALMLLCRREN